MKETETYTKVHDFLYDLDLPDVALRVFAFIFTVIVHANAQNAWGTKYIADHTHLSTRSVKQALRCLRGIGLVRVNGRAANGANVYVPKVSDCQTTTEARHRLVHSVHR